MHTSSFHNLRREILAALGCFALLNPACAGDDAATASAGSSGETTGETGEATTGEASTSTGDSASASSTSSGSDSGSASEGTTGSTSEATSDGTSGTTSEGTTTGSTSEGTTGEGTTTGSTSEVTTGSTSEGTTGGADCDPVPLPPNGLTQEYACFAIPDGLAGCDECDDACVHSNVDAAITMDPLFCSTEGLVIQCGPDPDADPKQCCYYAAYAGIVCEGRPLVVDGEVRAAPVRPRGDWLGGGAAPDLALDAATRAALADAWAEDARMEHASVAAFARLALELLAHGAPAELLAGAQRALGDEIRHAEACFALASAYAGHPQGPGALAIDGALERAPTLRELAVAAVVEGCVGETIAASIARVSAATATDPAVRAALAAIAADESRHAAFSWRLVRWAIEAGGVEIRAAVADALAMAVARPAKPRPVPAGIDREAWIAHGRLSAEDEAAVIRDALREVVVPCAGALLGAPTAARVELSA